ncbi:MAG: creatininase family protein, partial [Thermoleophilia bacterium]|nr:creatininase family protein [Thermoleophilia bacterium]
MPHRRPAPAGDGRGPHGRLPLPAVGREPPGGGRAGARVSTVRRWDELTREELAELAPSALLVLPVGTTEQHGPHLATGTDALIAGAVAERAAAAAARPETILLAPTLAYGASDHHLPFGGTLS